MHEQTDTCKQAVAAECVSDSDMSTKSLQAELAQHCCAIDDLLTWVAADCHNPATPVAYWPSCGDQQASEQGIGGIRCT